MRASLREGNVTMAIYELSDLELDAVSAGTKQYFKKVEINVAKANVDNNQQTKFIAIKSVVVGVDNSNSAINTAVASAG